jgi:outer membrane protein W
VTSLGIGGTVRFEYAFMPELHGTFTTGYWMFMGKEVNSVDLPNTNGIPILVGAKYYFMPAAKAKARVYGAAELGLLIMSMGDKDLMYNGVKIGTIEGGSSTEFCLAPTVGVEFPIADNGNLDISAKYLLITSDPTASNIGFRLGYKFGLN